MEKRWLVLAAVLLIGVFAFSKLSAQSIVSVSEIKFDEVTGGFLITKTIDLNEDILLQKGTKVDAGGGKQIETKSDVIIRPRPVKAELVAPAQRLLLEGSGRLQYRFSDATCSFGTGILNHLNYIPYGFGSKTVQIAYTIELLKGGSLLESKLVQFGGTSNSELQRKAPSSVSLYGGKVVVSSIGTLGGGVELPELSDVVVFKNIAGGVSEPRSKSYFSSSVLQSICGTAGNDRKFACQAINRDCNVEAKKNFDHLPTPGGYGGFKSFYYFDGVNGKWTLYEDQRQLLATIFISRDVADAVFILPKVARPSIQSITSVGEITFNNQKRFCATIKNDGDEGQVEVTAFSGTNAVVPLVQRATFAAGQTRDDVCFYQFGQQSGSSFSGQLTACGISQFSSSVCDSEAYGYSVGQPPVVNQPTPTPKPGETPIGGGGQPELVPDCAKLGEFVWNADTKTCVSRGGGGIPDWLIGLLVVGLVAGGGYLLLKGRKK